MSVPCVVESNSRHSSFEAGAPERHGDRAFVGAVTAAALIGLLGRVRGLGADAAVASVASAALSVGVAAISAARGTAGGRRNGSPTTRSTWPAETSMPLVARSS